MASISTIAARSASRAPARAAKRRKVTRPPQPRIPADFFDPEAYALLKTLLIAHTERWQTEGQPPIYVHRNDSNPCWGADAQRPCSGTTVRILRLHILSQCLGMDLECVLRLLTLTWNDKNQTIEGNHEVEEWRQSLSGCLWRIGQLYRELKRRKGAEAARHALVAEMENLWQPDVVRVYLMLSALGIDDTPVIEGSNTHDAAHEQTSARTLRRSVQGKLTPDRTGGHP